MSLVWDCLHLNSSFGVRSCISPAIAYDHSWFVALSHPWRYAIYVMFVLKRLQLLQLEREWDASALSRINLVR